jgi:hypothetical protein
MYSIFVIYLHTLLKYLSSIDSYPTVIEQVFYFAAKLIKN